MKGSSCIWFSRMSSFSEWVQLLYHFPQWFLSILCTTLTLHFPYQCLLTIKCHVEGKSSKDRICDIKICSWFMFCFFFWESLNYQVPLLNENPKSMISKFATAWLCFVCLCALFLFLFLRIFANYQVPCWRKILKRQDLWYQELLLVYVFVCLCILFLLLFLRIFANYQVPLLKENPKKTGKS